jgi:hypothetical protein
MGNRPQINFLGIGAQTCGTPWLYERLCEHLQVSLPGGKEMHFLDKMFGCGVEQCMDWVAANDGKMRGDIAPACGPLPPSIIHECCMCIGVVPPYADGDKPLPQVADRGIGGPIRLSLMPALVSRYFDRICSLEDYLSTDLSGWRAL